MVSIFYFGQWRALGEILDENNLQSMIKRRHCLKMYSSKLACSAILPPHGDTQQLCNNPDGL